jgi:hypothetical membrane protein
VPAWAVLSSAAAPVLLIGGWTVAAARQLAGFDPVTETISALAAMDADDRWIMTTALAGVGVCHMATALGLREAAVPGRWALAAGGMAMVLVAAFPLSVDQATTAVHTAVAGAALGALGVWPALSWRRAARAWALRRSVALPAAAGLLGLVGWFLVGPAKEGLAERVAAGAQALWPLVAVVTCRRGSAVTAART